MISLPQSKQVNLQSEKVTQDHFALPFYAWFSPYYLISQFLFLCPFDLPSCPFLSYFYY